MVMSETTPFDLLVIGGGINGAGIARDASGRGLKVLLVEQNDLASATSSRSSKLVHGGLRYLEKGEFRLVREALKEREVLMRHAPHIIRPLRFILPHVQEMRPRWMIKLGLWLYDHLAGGMTLPRSGALNLETAEEGQPLLPHYTSGYFYSDCWVDDTRLVVLNAVDAARRGADIRTYTKLDSLEVKEGLWHAKLSGTGAGEVTARIVVNAAGPWVGQIMGQIKPDEPSPLRLVKGSHLVVKKLYDGKQAYICQNSDGRIVFFIPYEREFTLIGTTDIPFEGNPAEVFCSAEERDYLLDITSRFFKMPVTPADIVQSYSGVRSLYDDHAVEAKDITRDYVLKLDRLPAPLLTVYGGKVTTYRRLAEQAMKKLSPFINDQRSKWTAHSPLPSGDLKMPLADYIALQKTRYPWLPQDILKRWCRLYGTRMNWIVPTGTTMADLGEELVPGLYVAEVEYLRQHEFARTAEDILWRRTKLGLHLTEAQEAALAKRL